MTDNNYDHVYERLVERARHLSDEEKVRLRKTYDGLVHKAKKDQCSMPHSWYRRIRDGKAVLGFFVGAGVVISTYLTSDMTPHGEEI